MKMVVVGVALAAMLFGNACYVTRVRSLHADADGDTHTHRQWFAVGGLVQLSETGAACGENGVAYSESSHGFGDTLIAIGLGVIGGAAGHFACKEDRALCHAAGAVAFPIALGSRTVEYKCARPSDKLVGRRHTRSGFAAPAVLDVLDDAGQHR